MNSDNHVSPDQLRIDRRREEMKLQRELRKIQKRKFYKFLLCLVLFVLVFFLYGGDFSFSLPFSFPTKGKGGKGAEVVSSQIEGKVIAYVPMDDRPIHKDMINDYANALQLKVEMPDTKFIKTHLGTGGNSYTGYQTSYGNPLQISSWLLEMEEDGCDYYVISLDQLFSGGLVGSSYLSDKDLNVYGKTIYNAKNAFEKIIKNQENHVYLIDSIMGDHVEAGFMDITEQDASLLTQYSAVARPTLSGGKLTVSKIYDAYSSDSNGNSISTELDSTKLKKYLDARKRKLKNMQYVVEKVAKSKNLSNIHLYYGIENASSTPGIQDNDISFVRGLIKENKLDVIFREQVSSLSEVAFLDMLLDSIPRQMHVKTTYFGDKDQKLPSSSLTYEQALDDLYSDLDLLNDGKNIDFEVLVYPREEDPERREGASQDLISHYLKNIQKKIPTIIINHADYTSDTVLIDYLRDYSQYQVPMGYLIGYSNHDSFYQNARLSLTEGVLRTFYFISMENQSDCDCDFMKLMMKTYVENIAYLPIQKTVPLNQMEGSLSTGVQMIQNNMLSSNFITSRDDYQEKSMKTMSIYNYSFPWNRSNEIRFDVSVTLDDAKEIELPKETK